MGNAGELERVRVWSKNEACLLNYQSKGGGKGGKEILYVGGGEEKPLRCATLPRTKRRGKE